MHIVGNLKQRLTVVPQVGGMYALGEGDGGWRSNRLRLPS